MSEIARDEHGLMRNRQVLDNAEHIGNIPCGEKAMLLVTRGYRDGELWYQLVQLVRKDAGWTYADRAVYLPASAVGELVALLRGGGEG